MAAGGHRGREIFLGHFKLPSGDPDIDMLSRIVECYSNLPYENLTKIIKKFTAPSPDERLRGPVEVMTGYVNDRTGGTCFSLTYCLGSMLASAGYRSYPVMADMKRPNIHCALVVELGGRRLLVDPGYLLGEPVELGAVPVRVATTFGTVEIKPRGRESYDLFTVEGARDPAGAALGDPSGAAPDSPGGGAPDACAGASPDGVDRPGDSRPAWPDESTAAGPSRPSATDGSTAAGSSGSGARTWRYTVKTAAVSHSAFMRHWQDSFSLPMMSSLLLTKLTPEGHLYIKNHHLRMKGARGKTNENIRGEFEQRIASEFGIPPDITAEARRHIERLRSGWSAGARRGERRGLMALEE